MGPSPDGSSSGPSSDASANAKVSCADGFGDCNGDVADGCEVDFGADPDHCGACTHACSGVGTTARACTGGVCRPKCDAEHLDCDGDPDDGCEAAVLTDQNNCGACGHPCSLNGATARACVAGVCKPTCDGRSGDCTTPAAPDADDGCETNLVTSASNCGACGRNCLEGLCASAVCQPAELVRGVSLPGELTVDSKFVHFVEGSVIVRAAVTGFGGIPIVQSQDDSIAIAADGTYVYWIRANTKSTPPFDGAVRRVTSGQEDDLDVVTGIEPFALAVDGENVYWADGIDGKVHQATKDGGGARTVSPALDTAISLATDGVSVFAGLAGAGIEGLAQFPVGGGTFVETPAPYTTPFLEPVLLVLDPTHVYSWGYDGAKHRTVLLQMPKSLQGNPVTLIDSTTDSQLGIAADGAFVYFAQPDGIYRVPLTGGTARFLAASAEPVTSLVFADGALYWIDPPSPSTASGRVMKLAVFAN